MTGEDSTTHSWGYVILMSKALVLFVDAGLAKSFGVLIPLIVQRFGSNYATVGLICSMPPTLMDLCCPFVTLLLHKFNKRVVTMSGGLLGGVCVIACAFLKDIGLLGVCLALSGVGLSMGYMSISLALNEYFPITFVFVNTLASFGNTAGAMLLPVVTERSHEAYGYPGPFLIIGAITLHLVACGLTIRKAPQQVYPNGTSYSHLATDESIMRSLKDIETGHGEDAISKGKGTTEEDFSEQNLLSEGDQIIQGNLQNYEAPEHEPKTSKRPCILDERLFLLSIPIHFVLFYLVYSWMFFLVPHAEHLGIPASKAVFLSTIGGIGGIIGRLTNVIILYRNIEPHKAFVQYIIIGSICSLSFMLDFISAAYSIRAILAFVQGLCLLFEDSLRMFLVKKLVTDSRNFDMALAVSCFVGGAGSACSGTITGYLVDLTKSFTKVFIIIGAIHAIMVVHVLVIAVLHRRQNKSPT